MRNRRNVSIERRLGRSEQDLHGLCLRRHELDGRAGRQEQREGRDRRGSSLRHVLRQWLRPGDPGPRGRAAVTGVVRPDRGSSGRASIVLAEERG